MDSLNNNRYRQTDRVKLAKPRVQNSTERREAPWTLYTTIRPNTDKDKAKEELNHKISNFVTNRLHTV